MKSLTGTWFARLLEGLAQLIFRRPKLVFYPQVLLAGLCVFYTVKVLDFDVGRGNLVGAKKRYHRNFLRFKAEFPEQDDLVVVVESENLDKNRQFVERLGARLEAETNLFKDVFYKGDLKLLGNKALLFVPDSKPPTISADDFKDLLAFAGKLREPDGAMSAWLRDQLSAATRQALADFQGANTNVAKLLTTLTNDLNRVLAGPLIYAEPRFTNVTLRAVTQELLGSKPAGESLAHLNRLLLEDAYPQEIARGALDELLLTLKTYRPFIEHFSRATNLTSLFGMVNTQFRTAKREQNAETATLIKALPALERIISQAGDCLARPGTPPSPGIDALLGAGDQAQQQMYITFAGGRIFLLTAHAPTQKLNEQAVDRLRELVAKMQVEVPGVNIGVTGEPVLERDEMRQSQRDTTVASLVSLVLCALIFIYGYHETGRPIKATLCLLVGIAYTMGFATLVIGHLNILTITFVPILIGLAIDFGVHLITRYEEELRRGRSEQESMTKAIVFTGQGIFTGAMTTAGAFLAMGLTEFKGIQEMGIICGGGLLVSLVPMMTMLPVMLLKGRQNIIDHEQGDPFVARARLESLWLDRPVMVVVVIAVLCGLSLTQFPKVKFDYNLLNMQSKGLPAVIYERKLIDSAGKSVLFAAVLADSLDEAQALEKRIKTLSTVASVESMSRFLAEDPKVKLGVIGDIKKEVSAIRFADFDTQPVDVDELTATLYYLQGFCGLAAEEAEKSDRTVARQLISLRDAINDFRKQALARPDVASVKIAAFQQALFKDLQDTFHALATQDNSGGMRPNDLPDALRNRFVGATGKYLLQVFPKEDVWKRENQRAFVKELRQALTPSDPGAADEPSLWSGLQGRLKRMAGWGSPDDSDEVIKPIVTGTPIQLYEYTGLLVNSYIEAAWYSLAAIVILVLFHFRTLSSVLLSLLPVGIGSIWLGGLMGFFDIPLNPANIMTLPLVIGVGVTNGIHILNRFAEERAPSILAKSTGKAVLVSGLTAIAGFGSLIIAQHQGIQSLGLVMSVGIATCMIAGLTFVPAVLSLMMRAGAGNRQPSVDNA